MIIIYVFLIILSFSFYGCTTSPNQNAEVKTNRTVGSDGYYKFASPRILFFTDSDLAYTISEKGTIEPLRFIRTQTVTNLAISYTNSISFKTDISIHKDIFTNTVSNLLSIHWADSNFIVFICKTEQNEKASFLVSIDSGNRYPIAIDGQYPAILTNSKGLPIIQTDGKGRIYCLTKESAIRIDTQSLQSPESIAIPTTFSTENGFIAQTDGKLYFAGKNSIDCINFLTEAVNSIALKARCIWITPLGKTCFLESSCIAAIEHITNIYISSYTTDELISSVTNDLYRLTDYQSDIPVLYIKNRLHNYNLVLIENTTNVVYKLNTNISAIGLVREIEPDTFFCRYLHSRKLALDPDSPFEVITDFSSQTIFLQKTVIITLKEGTTNCIRKDFQSLFDVDQGLKWSGILSDKIVFLGKLGSKSSVLVCDPVTLSTNIYRSGAIEGLCNTYNSFFRVEPFGTDTLLIQAKRSTDQQTDLFLINVFTGTKTAFADAPDGKIVSSILLK